MRHDFWSNFCTGNSFRKYMRNHKGNPYTAITPVSVRRYEVTYFLHGKEIATMECSRTNAWDAIFDCGESLNLDMGEVEFSVKPVVHARFKVVAYHWDKYPSVGIGRNLKDVVIGEITRLDGTIGHLTELRPFKVGC